MQPPIAEAPTLARLNPHALPERRVIGTPASAADHGPVGIDTVARPPRVRLVVLHRKSERSPRGSGPPLSTEKVSHPGSVEHGIRIEPFQRRVLLERLQPPGIGRLHAADTYQKPSPLVSMWRASISAFLAPPGVSHRCAIGSSTMANRGIEAVVTQGRDEGLGAPVAEGGAIDRVLPGRGPAGGLGPVRLDRRLVAESPSLQMVGHEGLTLRDPDAAPVGHILARLLKGLEKLFLCVGPRLRSAQRTVPRWTSMPWAPASSTANASSAISPLAAAHAAIQSVTPASLPCPPPLPCGRAASDPVSRRTLIGSFMDLGETRKCRAASRCP